MEEPEEKTPHDEYLEKMENPELTKKDKARVMTKYIEKERNAFYQLDMLGSGPMDFLTEIYQEEKPEDISGFLNLVRFIIKDTIIRPSIQIDGRDVNAFEYMFNGNRQHSTSPMMVLLRNGKYKMTDMYFKAFVDEEIAARLNVNFEVNGKTFLNQIKVEGHAVENMYNLWKKYHQDFEFNTTIEDPLGQSFKSIINDYVMKDISSVKSAIRENNFEAFKEYFELLFAGKRFIIQEDFQLKEGGI